MNTCSSLKRMQDYAEQPKEQTPAVKPRKKLVKKRVTIQEPHEAANLLLESLPRKPSDQELINFCSNNNFSTHNKFCNHLQLCLHLPHPTRTAVGYLKSSNGVQHLLYVDTTLSSCLEDDARPDIKSRHDWLTKSRVEDAQGASLMKYKARLARQLAKAVLQFHSTPWLHESWTSHEVQLRPTNFSE